MGFEEEGEERRNGSERGGGEVEGVVCGRDAKKEKGEWKLEDKERGKRAGGDERWRTLFGGRQG